MTDPEYYDLPAIMRIPKGLHPSSSSKTAGAVSSLLRDDANGLKTHAEIFLSDKSRNSIKDLSPQTLVAIGVGLLAAAGVGYGIAKGVEHTKKRKVEKAKRGEVVVSVEVQLQTPSDEIASAEEAVPVVASTELDFVDEQPVISMSAAEWQELLRKVLLLGSVEERVWMLLSSVYIEDGNEAVLEWQRKMRELSPREITNEFRLLFEAHPELEDDETLAELLKIFVKGLLEDGKDTPKGLEE